MTPQFKTKLQNLINDAAEKHIKESVYNVIDGKSGFNAGCDFLMPLIESLIVTRDNYVRDSETVYSDMSKIIENHDKELLNLLRGEK